MQKPEIGLDPNLHSRGGRDINKMPRSDLGWSGRGGRSHVTFRCGRPPRLRRFGGSASFYYWRSHPSSRGGDYATRLTVTTYLTVRSHYSSERTKYIASGAIRRIANAKAMTRLHGKREKLRNSRSHGQVRLTRPRAIPIPDAAPKA
jgi:hypothetical protein